MNCRKHKKLEDEIQASKEKFTELEKEDVRIKNDYKQMKTDVKKEEKEIDDEQKKVRVSNIVNIVNIVGEGKGIVIRISD